MPAQGRTSRKPTVNLSKVLQKILKDEGIEEVDVSARSVDVPTGHLAVILDLSSPHSASHELLKAQRIANKECVKYLQGTRKAVK
jgi:hypothetical protein